MRSTEIKKETTELLFHFDQFWSPMIKKISKLSSSIIIIMSNSLK